MLKFFENLIDNLPIAVATGADVAAAMTEESDGGKEITQAEAKELAARFLSRIGEKYGVPIELKQEWKEKPDRPGVYWYEEPEDEKRKVICAVEDGQALFLSGITMSLSNLPGRFQGPIQAD